jgi:hypothetical protein
LPNGSRRTQAAVPLSFGGWVIPSPTCLPHAHTRTHTHTHTPTRAFFSVCFP